MKAHNRIIESYEEFLAEGSAGAISYGVVSDPSSVGSIGPEYMELLIPLAKQATKIMDNRVWTAVVKAVDICRDEIVAKLKSDNHKIWQDSDRLAKQFIEDYGQDYVASFLISRVQSR